MTDESLDGTWSDEAEWARFDVEPEAEEST